MAKLESADDTGKKRGGLRSLAIGCGSLFAVMMAAGFGYLAWANSPLPPEEAIPPLPDPNGRDLCVAALANRAIPPNSSPLNKPDSAPLDTLRRELAKPDPGAEKVRAALALEYRNPFPRDFGATYPEVSQFRPLARKWTAEARVALADGQAKVAIDRCLDALELGSRIPHGGGSMHHAVGVVCQMLPLKQAELGIPHLSASEARRAGRRLERIIAQAPPQSEFLEVERRAGLGFARAYFRGQGSALASTGLSDPSLTHPLVVAFYPKRWSYQNLEDYYRAGLAELKKPYPSRGQPSHARDPLCFVLLPAVSGMSSRLTERDAALALLRLELALHEYRATHGKYPPSLDALTPAILERVPVDPFTTKPFRYQVQGKGYRLYSLGSDGIDDGGTPIKNRKSSFGGPGDLVTGDLWPGE